MFFVENYFELTKYSFVASLHDEKPLDKLIICVHRAVYIRNAYLTTYHACARKLLLLLANYEE